MCFRSKIIIIFVLIAISANAVSNPKHEIRAVWLTTNWGLDWPSKPVSDPLSREKQKGELCRVLDLVKKLNFNVVFFQTRLRGDVLYPSAYEPWNYILTGQPGRNPGYDPLDYAIQACHERGLECHAWIVCIPVGSNRQVKSHRAKSVVYRHRDLCKYFNGEWYLDPGNPQTAFYLASLVKEIVTCYPVDGIHLDYIRYPENSHRFPDSDTYRKYAKPNQTLARWRQENINRIVYTIYDTVRYYSPRIKVSSSPLGKYNTLPGFSSLGWSCIETVYQDPQKWLKDGKQDFIVPMMYFSEQSFYPFLINWVQHKFGRMVVSGLGAYRLYYKEGDWSLSDFMRQIYDGRKYGIDGQALYRAGNLIRNDKRLLEELSSTVYAHPALMPPMPYLGNKYLSAPKPLEYVISKDSLYFLWDNVPQAQGYVLYGSATYPVDINNAGNIIEARISKNFSAQSRSLLNSFRYFAVTAFDDYYNESPQANFNQPFYNISEKIEYNKFEGKLYLDIENDIDQIIIQNILGKEIFKGRYSPKIGLQNIPNGAYRVWLIGKSIRKEKILLIF